MYLDAPSFTIEDKGVTCISFVYNVIPYFMAVLPLKQVVLSFIPNALFTLVSSVSHEVSSRHGII